MEEIEDTLWQEHVELMKAEQEPLEGDLLECLCDFPDAICPLHEFNIEDDEEK